MSAAPGVTHRGEAGIAELQARLIPPDNRWPNCTCRLLLSFHTLYVLEELYGREPEEHFAIPLSHVRGAELLGEGKQQNEFLNNFARFVIGSLSVFGDVGHSPQQPDPMLRVRFLGADGSEQTLRFCELDGNPRRFLEALRSLVPA